MSVDQGLTFYASPKQIRAVVSGDTLADSVRSVLMLEKDHLPVCYFPPEDVRLDLLVQSDHRTHCPIKGDATYWNLSAGGRKVENAAWSYERPVPGAERIGSLLAFYWDWVDHWFEEDEEVFGHPRDPYHRIDVRPSARAVTVEFGGETVARTRRGLFLFETGLPTRYYVPPQDVRSELLTPSDSTSICPYKGTAAYWSLEAGGKCANDAVWVYPDPLPECPRIRDHFCFYPEKVDQFTVEREEMARELAGTGDQGPPPFR